MFQVEKKMNVMPILLVPFFHTDCITPKQFGVESRKLTMVPDPLCSYTLVLDRRTCLNGTLFSPVFAQRFESSKLGSMLGNSQV